MVTLPGRQGAKNVRRVVRRLGNITQSAGSKLERRTGRHAHQAAKLPLIDDPLEPSGPPCMNARLAPNGKEYVPLLEIT